MSIRPTLQVEVATVTVTRNGDVIGEFEFQPTYEKFEEQPRRCGPTCVRAFADIAF
jgi:hypothetical protein